jgi:hypothetical protein
MGSEGVIGRGQLASARPTLCGARRRHVWSRRSRAQSVLAMFAVAGCFVVAAIGSTAAAGAAGILPPSNPPANIAPSDSDWLTSIDAARAVEGVGPMEVDESVLDSLPAPEQLFIVVNDERIDRGLPPIEYMSAQLNAVAAQSAASATDIVPPSSLSNGTAVTFGGAIWAGLSSVFESDYLWMYDDGSAGAPTTNAACTPASPSSCWMHRDIILHSFPSCGAQPPVLSMGAADDPGSMGAVVVSTCAAPSDITLTWQQAMVASDAWTIGVAAAPSGAGYWEAEANGTVGNFGSAPDLGSVTTPLNAPIVGLAATPDGGGYWLVGSDGGIFSFGDAHFYGSTGSLRLDAPIVGMASTPDGGGYWLVASDGGIFSYGDAGFYGSMGGKPLNQPIVGISADPATGGYWEVASDGGIFAYDAPFFGSTGNIRLNRPIVAMEASPNGQGYRFEASDGGVFAYGQAPFLGSTGGTPLVAPMVSMAPDDATNGYWLAAADGGIFTYGGASYLGHIAS